MTVTLKHSTPLHICSDAIRQCWQSQGKSDTSWVCTNCGDTADTYDELEDSSGCCGRSDHFERACGPADKALIERIGNKFKHSSTLEHLVYNFDISGVSRALLQELARHRMASLSVKSTRYTLKELKAETVICDDAVVEEMFSLSNYEDINDFGVYQHASKYLVMTGNLKVDIASILALEELRKLLVDCVPNDLAKYCLPEAYKTSLSWTINARSLQNFLSLRSSKATLWEIRDLAQAIFDALPEDHKYLFEHCLDSDH